MKATVARLKIQRAFEVASGGDPGYLKGVVVNDLHIS